MPAYDFRCSECETVFEITRPFGTTDPVACPDCGGSTKKLFSPVGVVFKGSGFHNTDYRKQPHEKTAASTSEDAKDDSTPCTSADSKSSTCSDCPSAPGNDS